MPHQNKVNNCCPVSKNMIRLCFQNQRQQQQQLHYNMNQKRIHRTSQKKIYYRCTKYGFCWTKSEKLRAKIRAFDLLARTCTSNQTLKWHIMFHNQMYIHTAYMYERNQVFTYIIHASDNLFKLCHSTHQGTASSLKCEKSSWSCCWFSLLASPIKDFKCHGKQFFGPLPGGHGKPSVTIMNNFLIP